jgi:hypothetical protein
MSQSERERIAYFEEAWHSELNNREKELVLQDTKQHQYLSTLWDMNPSARTWLASDSIAGVTLVDSLNHSGMSVVCRGISLDGNTLCIKVPNYEGHSPQSWDLLESAIRNEAKVLKQLTVAKASRGEIPKYISDGHIQALGRQCPYVSMTYLFGLIPIESYIADSKSAELELCRCIAELLGEVHRCGVVHGDLHQGNILVNSMRKPTLLDFGASQIRSFLPLNRRFEKRHFGPLMALHIAEVLEPHRPLSFAFDVLCLAELMQRRLGQYFEPIDEISSQLLQGNAIGIGRRQQSSRFHALIRKCTEPEPEHRLRDSTKVAQALSNLEFGPAVDNRKQFLSNLRVLCRKNFATVAFAVTCITFLIFLSSIAAIQYQHQRRITQDQAFQAVKDGDMLLKLREANQAALVSMQELIEGATERGRVLEEVDVSVRNSVAKRLIGLMESGILDLESEVTALGLALQISGSVVELDGWEPAKSSTLAARKLADRLQNQYGKSAPPEVPLFAIQSLAILSRIHFEKGGVGAGEQSPQEQAELAARQFLELPQKNYEEPELRKKFSETGFQLAFHALYRQRDEPWSKQSHGDLLWRVLDRSLQMVTGHKPRSIRQEASLRRLRGLAMYKSAFKGAPYFTTDLSFAELAQKDYQYVLDLLRQATENADEISVREARHIQASVSSVIGMLMTNKGKFEEAQFILKETYAIRRTTADEFPGSLNRQKEFISTGWNYADAIFSEAMAKTKQADLAPVYMREIAVRKVVVEKCLQVLSRDRSRESEEAYLVNSVRLARSYYFSNQSSLALATMKEIEWTIGMENLTFQTLRFEAIPVLLLHAKHSDKQAEFLHSYLEELLVFLNDPKTRQLAEQDFLYTRLLFLEDFRLVHDLPPWPQLVQRLEPDR